MEPETEKTGIPDGGARRGRLLMLLLLLWLIAAAVQAVRLGVFQRDELRQLSGKIALERGVLAAPRGRLLDADGVVLAWDEQAFVLSAVSELSEADYLQLQTALPDRHWVDGRCRLPATDLAPLELIALEELIMNGLPLKITRHTRRLSLSDPPVRQKIGAVELVDGRRVGVSGWEAQFDAELSGTPGSYEVFRDRRRRWMPETWRLVAAPIPGRDVVVDWRLAESGELP